MKKNVKVIFKNVIKTLLVLITLATSFGYASLAFALQSTVTKGSVVDSNNSVGSENDVIFTKDVTKDDNQENVYDVHLTVNGKDKTVKTSKTAPIYAVVVFDRSGSMENYYCDIITSIFNGCKLGNYVKKMDNAVDGAKDFATSLLSSFSNAQIALVTFSSSAQVTRGFDNSNLNDVNFGIANGNTALGDGINAAEKLLDGVKTDANKYIIIMSDGEPTTNNHTSAANSAKLKGYEIFAIGYEDNGTTLKNIVSTPQTEHYSDGNAFNISDVFTDIVGNLEVRIPAARNITITDSIAEGFTYVENSADPATAVINGNIITFKLDDIPAAGKTVSFKIKATNLKEGYNRTNDFAKIEYTNTDDKNDSKTIEDSARVYWEDEKYSITVNYYKDEVKNENLLGSISSDKIYKLDDMVNASSIDLNAKKTDAGNGYKDGKIVSTMPYKVTKDENIINVVYSKKDNLNYVVEYYKDNEKISEDSENTFNGQTYHDLISENQINKNKYKPSFGYQDGVITNSMPYTIEENGNVIKVKYNKRTDMSYTVKYVEGNKSILNDEVRTGKTYLENCTETAKVAPFGYRLVGNNTQSIVVDEDNKIITFNYEKRDDFKYTVNYVDEDGNILSSTEKTEKTYLETYTETAIEINGYEVIVNNENPNPREITITEENQIVTFNYKKRTDLTYTVNYYKDDTTEELIGSTTVENQTFGDSINSSDININLYIPEKGYNEGVITTSMPITITTRENIINVIYTKKDNLGYRVEYYFDGIIDSSKTEYFEGFEFGTVIYNYTDKLSDGYIFVSDTAPLTIDDSNDNVIKVYYETASTGDITAPDTGISSNNYLSVTYIISIIGFALISKKESNN